MPTTQEEAAMIVGISQKYLPLERLKMLLIELDEQVGKKSENDSVQQSFAMFRELVEHASHALKTPDQPNPNSPTWLAAFSAIWVFHTFLILGNIASLFVTPFMAPWYLAFPACFAIVWTVCSSANCAITDWENTVRAKLGWKPIRSFVGHYYMKPIYKFLGKTNAAPEQSVQGA